MLIEVGHSSDKNVSHGTRRQLPPTSLGASRPMMIPHNTTQLLRKKVHTMDAGEITVQFEPGGLVQPPPSFPMPTHDQNIYWCKSTCYVDEWLGLLSRRYHMTGPPPYSHVDVAVHDRVNNYTAPTQTLKQTTMYVHSLVPEKTTAPPTTKKILRTELLLPAITPWYSTSRGRDLPPRLRTPGRVASARAE